MGFHDAAAWDKTQPPGGADASLILSSTEINRPENSGLDGIRQQYISIQSQFPSIGFADLVQFGHNVATVLCPLGPRLLTYVGRPDWTPSNGEAPTGLLPDANSPAETLLDLFANKTIFEVSLVSLIGAHTTANQFFFDTTKAGQPLDSTPGIWDVKFYSEVVAGTPPAYAS